MGSSWLCRIITTYLRTYFIEKTLSRAAAQGHIEWISQVNVQHHIKHLTHGFKKSFWKV